MLFIFSGKVDIPFSTVGCRSDFPEPPLLGDERFGQPDRVHGHRDAVQVAAACNDALREEVDVGPTTFTYRTSRQVFKYYAVAK